MTCYPMKITVDVTSKGQERLIQSMAKKLVSAADHKPRKWTGMSVGELMRKLYGEADELETATPGDAWDEAADVANFAAMVADQKTRNA